MLRLLLLSFLSICLGACSSIHAYHPTIQQGNIIQESTASQLKIGMSRDQVVALMGEPVAHNLFADNQLAYIYTSKPNRGPLVYKRVIVTLKNDRVVSIDRYLPPAPSKG